MSERPDPVIVDAMRKVSGKLADMAEAEADDWKDVPGDVALRSFAEAIRRTIRGALCDT